MLEEKEVKNKPKVDKRKCKTNDWKTPGNKKSKMLPSNKVPVIILEDIRYHKYYQELVADQLGEDKKSNKKKEGASPGVSTARGTVLNCSYCDYTTNKKFNLQEHISRRHGNETVFLCTYCSYKTSIKRFLDSHMKAKHSKMVEVYECFYCNYRVKQKLHLIIHINASHAKTTL